jgi:prepilin-type processing-associated H-X9-DG protein
MRSNSLNPKRDRSRDRIQQWLIEPHPGITDTARRHQARLLSSLILVLLIISAISLFIIPLKPDFPVAAMIGELLVAALIYSLSRTRHYLIAASLFILTTAICTFVFFAVEPGAGLSAPLWGALAITLSGVFLPKRATVVTGAATSIAVIVILMTVPGQGDFFEEFMSLLFLLLSLTVLTVVFSHHRNVVESDRRAELQSAKDNLEIRVQERTAELQDRETTEREHREFAESLVDITAALNSTLDLDELFERILESIDRVAPNDGANIMLLDGHVSRIVRARGYAEHGLEAAVLTRLFPVASTPSLKKIVETRQGCAHVCRGACNRSGQSR